MVVSQIDKVSENTQRGSTTVRLPSQAADNSYRTVLCMLLSLFILSAVLTIIGFLMSTWKGDYVTAHLDRTENNLRSKKYQSLYESEKSEKSATKYTDTQTMTTTYYADNEPHISTSTTFADTALNTHTPTTDLKITTKSSKTPEYDTQPAIELDLKTTTSSEASVETVTVTATELTITSSRILPDEVTIPPNSSTSEGKTTTKQQDQEIQPNTTTIKPPNVVGPPPRNECTTLSCKRSASQMISMMDHGADPCEDFFQYSCGGSEYNHIKGNSPDEEVLKTLPELDDLNMTEPVYKTFSTVYSKCMNYKNGDGLIEAAKFVYELCVNNTPTDNKSIDLTNLMARLLLTHPQRSSSRLLPMFDVIMEIGPNQTFIPTITIPNFESPLADSTEGDIYHRNCLSTVQHTANIETNAVTIYELYEQCMRNQSIYMDHMETAIDMLQVFEHLPDYFKQQETKGTLAFIEWNILNRLGSLSEYDRLPKNKKPPVFKSVSYLQQKFPQIIWHQLFNLLTDSKNDSSTIEIIKIEYVEQLVKIFDFFDRHNFMDIKTPLLSMIAHDLYIDFIRPQGAVALPQYRRDYCRKVAVQLMPDIAAKLYLNQFSARDLIAVDKMTDELFNQIIQKLTTSISNDEKWLSESDINKINLKLNDLKLFGGASQVYADDKFRDVYTDRYSDILHFAENTDYVTIVFRLKAAMRKQMYSVMHYGNTMQPKFVWTQLTSPMSTSIIRIEHLNLIVVPFGVIVTALPLLHRSQKFEQFATLGLRIAHEIAHFFDTTHLSSVLSRENDIFKSFIHILNDPQFAKVPNPFQLKLEQKDIYHSIDNRFSDDASLRTVHDTYLHFQPSILTADAQFLWLNFYISKLFFLKMSQQHCYTYEASPKSVRARTALAIQMYRTDQLPSYFRVTSMVMNSLNFAETFDCPTGSSMNPAFKIDQFPYISKSEVDYLPAEIYDMLKDDYMIKVA